MAKKITQSIKNILSKKNPAEQEKLNELKKVWEEKHMRIEQIFTAYEMRCTLNGAVSFFELGKDLGGLHSNEAVELTNEILNALKERQDRVNNQIRPSKK
ncbi:MAG: hypothetical protein NTX91_04560 [candidate division SR1 bacterium]|nr:hypothetical protein [candidate division SR1 bacterium]